MIVYKGIYFKSTVSPPLTNFPTIHVFTVIQ